jgi:hypothetical protein
MNELEQRVVNLEQSVRRQRLIISGLLLAVVAAVTMAAAPQGKDAEFDTVRARGLFVVDSAGKMRAGIVSNENNTALGILNKTGKEVLSIGSEEDGGYLWIKNKTGEVVVHAYVDEYGKGAVYAGDRKGMGRYLKP